MISTLFLYCMCTPQQHTHCVVWSGPGDMVKNQYWDELTFSHINFPFLACPVCCFVLLCRHGLCLKAVLSAAWCTPGPGESHADDKSGVAPSPVRRPLPTHVPAVVSCCFICRFATQHLYITLSLIRSLQYWCDRFDLHICLNYFQLICCTINLLCDLVYLGVLWHNTLYITI